MSWSTTAPSGVTWSAASETSKIKNNYYYYWAEASIARGATNVVYVRVKLLAQLYNYDARDTAPNIEMQAQVNGAGASSYTSSAIYALARPSFGATVTVKTVYWTGTAASGAKAYARASNTAATSGAVTLTAPAYTTKYTVSYNGNGSTGGSTAAQSKLYGSAVSLASNGFTRTGYHFVAWNTKADGTGTSYSPGASYSANANLTLYAIWEINTYTVTYEPNGGNGITDPQTKIYDVDLVLRDCGFTYFGHRFNHWNTKADDSGTRYEAGAVYTGNEDLTLYAIWDGTWPVIYDGNGATGGATESQTKVEGLTLVLRSNGFIRDKYSFIEWNTAPDGSGTSYREEQVYTANAELTLYAIWVKNNIPVYYNDNGTVRQVERAYYNDNGEIRECSLYYNDAGTVRPIV